MEQGPSTARVKSPVDVVTSAMLVDTEEMGRSTALVVRDGPTGPIEAVDLHVNPLDPESGRPGHLLERPALIEGEQGPGPEVLLAATRPPDRPGTVRAGRQ
jgi:hypothetical protein